MAGRPLPLPAPDGSGALVVALDLHAYEAVAEHSDGRVQRVPLTPDRSVGAVTRELLAAVRAARGPGRAQSHAAGDDVDDAARRGRGARDASTRRASTRTSRPRPAPRWCSAALRAPYRGRSTPVNAWWGSFDLAVSLFSGKPAEPPGDDFIMRNAGDAEQIEVGWWPGDARYPRAAFYAYAHPAPAGFENATLAARRGALGRDARRVHPRLGRHPRRARIRTRRARLRALGGAARLRGLRLGPRRWPPARTAFRRRWLGACTNGV